MRVFYLFKTAAFAGASLLGLLAAGAQGTLQPPGLVPSQSAASSPPIRIGTNSAQLSLQDVVELQRLAAGKAWLVDAPQNQQSILFVHLYLRPETTTRELRRGEQVSVTRRLSAGEVARGEQPPGWVIDLSSKYNYAQVAIDGRAFDDVKDDNDLNRPFRVVGQFTDADLVSLVRFIRSMSKSLAAIFPRHSGDFPIISIERENAQVEVTLRNSDFSGPFVRLRQEGKTWVVISQGGWQN